MRAFSQTIDLLSRTVDASRADLVHRLADPAPDRARIEQAVTATSRRAWGVPSPMHKMPASGWR